ncbi:hypothetical protein E1B28_003457 [Marasmius oreades]|uniref:Uncharacterized protein n=1 Tax=Marasmius oreades TaxID=181124 RepID=A0A9P7RMK1_9AGAR|nr:uncharacterized protein E1B28_003457 [Marasmius oreades]KAG7085926.1 hypothetical protein E1B28_003457 [Marasmius oreades]
MTLHCDGREIGDPHRTSTRGEEWKIEMHREYDWFPTGRIKILRILDVRCRAKDYEDEPDHLDSYEGYDTSRANRTAHLACISVEAGKSLLRSYVSRILEAMHRKLLYATP